MKNVEDLKKKYNKKDYTVTIPGLTNNNPEL